MGFQQGKVVEDHLETGPSILLFFTRPALKGSQLTRADLLGYCQSLSGVRKGTQLPTPTGSSHPVPAKGGEKNWKNTCEVQSPDIGIGSIKDGDPVMYMCMLSHSGRSNSSATPWTAAHQVPLALGFPRQEYWSGFPFPLSEDLSDPGIEPLSPALQADSLLLSPRPSYEPQIFLLSNTTYPSIRKKKYNIQHIQVLKKNL